MTTNERLALFVATRPRLLRLAYRYMQTVAEAEDVVQDAWLRFAGVDAIENGEALLSRIVTRLCLDRLKSAARRRETYVGPWLPEPLVDVEEPASDKALDISFGVMRALETLSPEERAAFFLHDLFDIPFAEVAAEIGKTPAACRKLAERARGRLASARRRRIPDEGAVRRFVDVFLRAVGSGDSTPLRALLAEDVEFVSDGGGKALAALNVLRGRDAVTRFLLGIVRKLVGEANIVPARINGMAGLLVLVGGQVDQTFAFDLDRQGHIAAFYTVRNPDKLQSVQPACPASQPSMARLRVSPQ